MIPENASPGDVLDVFDETSHKVHVLLADTAGAATTSAAVVAMRSGHPCVASSTALTQLSTLFWQSDSPNSMRAPTDDDLFENGHGRCLPSNRYNLTLPWTKPFADPHIYENRNLKPAGLDLHTVVKFSCSPLAYLSTCQRVVATEFRRALPSAGTYQT